MLILTLKKDEKIFIGENISVTMVQIRGNDVRVGIDAPTDITILRDKVLKKQIPDIGSTSE